MKVSYVVVDASNNLSWNSEKEEGETFASLASATKRAEKLAGYEPGQIVSIYEKVGEAIAQVLPVKTTSRK